MNRTTLVNIFILLIGVIGVFVSFLSDEIFYSLVLFFLFVLLVIFANSNNGLADPRLFFLPFFYLYSTWFPMQVMFASPVINRFHLDENLLIAVVNYAFLGGVFFCLGVFLSLRLKKITPPKSFIAEVYTGEMPSERLLILGLFFFVIFGLCYAFFSGAVSKREIIDDGGVVISVIIFSFILLTALISMRLLRFLGEWKLNFSIYLFLCLSFCFMLVLGERDAVFRIFMVMALIYYDFNRRGSLVFLALMVLGAILVVPFSQAFKSALISGQFEVSVISLDLILSNEFVSASRNLYSLLYYGVNHGLSYFYTDIVRGVFPSFISGVFLDIGSTSSWYNRVYRVEHGFSGGSGWGFGLVAQGYLIAGLAGISVLMFLVGLFLGFLFSLRFRSEYWYVFFIMSAAASIYCIRADIGALIAQTAKVSGGAVFFIFLTHELFKRRSVL
ncbi:oligosaccharide repeat unit polymerase [Ectopseudomonas mendocina]|uniref:Oligosaccharide repeat unit polymerase n=1 Tax=Ectopseudomonas mendocina TaxID=300 RepID=A0ABD7RPX2_ECTME|nr:O-antigen polymerase [Pseudomonas mendocina]TRO10078.1 oligosaccharide repeat unit polymerase [Pseudomonas mendocina]TRO12146.1 oligosaccharide repeat unit polymerase [Pseudomonas mendocina]